MLEILINAMSVKHEHPLNLDPEIKLKIEIDKHKDGTEAKDKKSEIEENVKPEPEPEIEKRPIFQCKNCNMTEQYDCFSHRVPFNRNVRTKTDYYLARDPFSPRSKRQFLILGSVCSLCDKDVCIKPECSIFYSKFFCSVCARKNISNFPTCIQEKIKSANRI